jgi:hypothetical protein
MLCKMYRHDPGCCYDVSECTGDKSGWRNFHVQSAGSCYYMSELSSSPILSSLYFTSPTIHRLYTDCLNRW